MGATSRSPAGSRDALPSGTVTFAFTDIEGSTRRWEHDRPAMQDAVRRHDALLRAAIGAHAGVVFKTVGDAFCAAFARAEDALAAMLAAQRALAAEDFSAVDGVRVRMAMHTGTADERDGDYFGPTVNRVARLLALGHGGQMLLSGAAADLVAETLPPDVSLRDLGDHQLKDLVRRERVYQVLAPELTDDFPPLRSLAILPNNLPASLTSFVGRDTEIAQITALMETHRLVSLIGSGGIGKTRTSLEVAAKLLEGRGDGVWFVELAPLTNGDYIPSTIAQAFGITLASDGAPIDNLVRALERKHALLVVDNCEHLIVAAAWTVSALLRGCPRLAVLASSRQALGIAGEAAYRMPSLPVPVATEDGALRAVDAKHYPATAMFVERAHASDPHFILTDDDAPVVADICRRLDGIPLAIELAAARVTILSPRQLRDRLDERFRVLTGGSRDVLPRQQTLRALIDWSHDLLDERERALFRRLGIFVDGFTFDGAVAVGSGDDLHELDIFDVLASLVDKSLVLAEPAGDALRYRMLESTRAYAAEKLEAAGEHDRAATHKLHHLRDRIGAAREIFERTGRKTELQRLLATELEDVRATLDAGLQNSDLLLAAAMLTDVGSTWAEIGLDGEAMARIDGMLATLPVPESRLRARLSSALARLAANSGQMARALRALSEAVAHARASGDSRTLAEALIGCGDIRLTDRLDDAETALAEAESFVGASAALRNALLESRARLRARRGDFAAAALDLEQLRAAYVSLGDEPQVLILSLSLAEIEHAGGHTQRAIAIVQEIVPVLRSRGDTRVLTNALANLAGYHAALDDPAGAAQAGREAIRELATREPASAFVVMAIEHLAYGLAADGEVGLAVRLEGYADTALQRLGYAREFTEATTHERLTELLRDRLSPDDLARMLVEGGALSPEDAVALALGEPRGR